MIKMFSAGSKTTAPEAVEVRKFELNVLLQMLMEKVAQADGKNWADVGSLSYVTEQVEDVLAFLGTTSEETDRTIQAVLPQRLHDLLTK